jgi:hypothetical protein
MSFEAWLRTMGATAAETEGTGRAAAAPVVNEQGESLAEPSSAADDNRQRATYPLPEKPREAAPVRTSRKLLAPLAGAFAIGLLLGGVAMMRMRSGIGQRRRAAGASHAPGPHTVR